MENPYGYKNTIIKAAARARGTLLTPLHMVIEGQKSISTKKLNALVENLQDGLQQDAIHFKYLADRINELEAKLSTKE